MVKTFRDFHIFAFFKGWSDSKTPLDLALGDYFRAHKSLGSHDRREIGDAVYGLVRWKSLFDVLDPSNSISLRLKLYQKNPIEHYLQESSVPPWARLGLSPFLYQKFTEALGPEKTEELGDLFNSSAPIAVRANLLKTSREELLRKWASTYDVRPGTLASTAILFAKREPLFATPEFKEGLFEVQDEGSQVIASLVAAKPGDRVLDYCSGSGGKTLAIAPMMQKKGELYLHDIRAGALREAQKRLRRAGVQNAQILEPEHPTLNKLKNKMDWVLADVPCSGTGTLRRNPDMKWKIDAPMLERLVEEQKAIMQKAVQFLKPDGRIVYSTCSLLPEENEAQVDYFLRHLPLVLEGQPIRTFSSRNECDGFFGALFRKRTIQ
jgi:16S rRNA C967 or C1407 C5-methylase (RsmB/RsmF family)